MNTTTIVKVNTLDAQTSRWKIESLDDKSVWEVEKLLDLPKWTTWIDSHPYWWIYPISLYLIGVHLGPIVMRNNKPYKLSLIINIWNVILAVFSIAATVRVAPILLDFFGQENGLHRTVCTR